jgi:hypothetical protein
MLWLPRMQRLPWMQRLLLTQRLPLMQRLLLTQRLPLMQRLILLKNLDGLVAVVEKPATVIVTITATVSKQKYNQYYHNLNLFIINNKFKYYKDTISVTFFIHIRQ